VIDREQVHKEAREAGSRGDAMSVDVAIVGAGVSGLYSGYRLLTGAYEEAARPASVCVLELSNRLGGRLHSVVLPGMTVTGELGGMRYMAPTQEIVTALIEKVFAKELKPKGFPMGNPASHFFYLRKQRFQANSWQKAQGATPPQRFITRYHLDEADLGFSADQLFNKIVYDVLMADPKIKSAYGKKISNPKPYSYVFQLTARDWDKIKPTLRYVFDGPYSGALVNDLGFWNLIKDQTSEEGYDFLADAGGYYSNTINWNAAEAFPYMVGDFTQAKFNYYTLEGGYDGIALALAKHYLAQPGASIRLETRLLRLDRAPTGQGRRYQLTLRDEKTGKECAAFADAVILAMPRRSLELLDQDSFAFQTQDGASTKLAKMLPTAIMEPSLKILMGFEEPWWREDFGADAGESITDLPIRQCYYFGEDPEDSHSLFLAGYTDMTPVRFWEALDKGDLFVPRPTRLVSARELESLQCRSAPAAMVAEAMQQVRELHGIPGIPKPFVTCYRDWTEDPFGGGYHAWQPGISVKDVMEFMRRPVENEAIHICGEAYSDQQGWVEGALCVAERMLQDHFGLRWPTWLDSTYYLGW
jgi:monoamine oxidase